MESFSLNMHNLPVINESINKHPNTIKIALSNILALSPEESYYNESLRIQDSY